MTSSKVSIIILNWNGKFDTEECLRSLEKVTYDNFDVIVVDNGSNDDSVEYLKDLFPKVAFIANQKNIGFAEGNNIGFKEALRHGSRYALILNNDTIVDPDFVAEMVQTAERDTSIVAVSPKIYNYHEPRKIESAGFVIKPTRAKAVPFGYGETDAGQYDHDKEISFASGCALLIRTDAITSELFDPYYFAYCEDLDFCYNVTKQGLKLWYSHKAKVWHKVSTSTGGYKSPLSVYLFTKNRFRFVRKNLVFSERLFFYSYLLFYAPAFIALSVIKTKKMVLAINFLNALLSTRITRFSDARFEFSPVYAVIGVNARYLQRQITGIERYTTELIKNVAELDGVNKYVLFFNKHEPFVRITDKPNFSMYVTTIPTQFRVLRIIWEQFWLAYELRRKEVTLFHGPSFLVPVGTKAKRVITIHDLSFFKYPESFTLENKLYFKFFLPHSIRTADMIIANSETTKSDIISYFKTPSDKIKVTYLGVGDNYAPVQDVGVLQGVKKKYALPDKFILFVGVLSPRKNLQTTLLAFSALKRKGFPHKFVIVGKKGWLYESIFETIRVLNIQSEIIFADYVCEEDLPYFYNLADVFVLASLYEGFGLPIIEAMACGCPVITSNVSSMPEIAGDAALLVDPFKIEVISRAIERVISEPDLRQALVAKGFQQARKFSWVVTAQKTLEVYNELIQGQRTR